MNTALLTLPLLLSGVSAPALASPKMLGNPYGEEIDYSVVYNGNTYQRTVYCPNNYIYISDDGEGSNLYLGTESPNSIQTLSNSWIHTAGEIQIIDEIPQSYQSWRDNGEKDGASYTANECYCWFYYNASSDVVTYWEFFGSTSLFWNFSWDDNASKYVEDVYDTAPDFSNMDLYDSSYFFFDEGLLNEYIGELTWTHPRNIPETQPVISNASLYDIVEDFYDNNLFNNEELENMTASVGDNNMSMRSWLSHTATIATLVVLFVAVFSLLFAIFRLFAHLSANLFD